MKFWARSRRSRAGMPPTTSHPITSMGRCSPTTTSSSFMAVYLGEPTSTPRPTAMRCSRIRSASTACLRGHSSRASCGASCQRDSPATSRTAAPRAPHPRTRPGTLAECGRPHSAPSSIPPRTPPSTRATPPTLSSPWTWPCSKTRSGQTTASRMRLRAARTRSWYGSRSASRVFSWSSGVSHTPISAIPT